MPDSAINHASGVFAPGHLGELTRVIPFEMVDAALAMAGGKERRVRRLPSRVVIYVLLAGVLFSDQGWKQDFSRLVAGLPDPVKSPSASALSEAMRRVGVAPLRELFTLVKGPAVTGANQVTRFAGRPVMAIDGTPLAVTDIVDLVGRIGTAVLAELMPKRRIRIRPRVIKRVIWQIPGQGTKSRPPYLPSHTHHDNLDNTPSEPHRTESPFACLGSYVRGSVAPTTRVPP